MIRYGKTVGCANRTIYNFDYDGRQSLRVNHRWSSLYTSTPPGMNIGLQRHSVLTMIHVSIGHVLLQNMVRTQFFINMLSVFHNMIVVI